MEPGKKPGALGSRTQQAEKEKTYVITGAEEKNPQKKPGSTGDSNINLGPSSQGTNRNPPQRGGHYSS